MRPFDPVPLTRDRSTPSSRANARTDGDACAFLKPSLSTGGAAAWPAALAGADGAAGAEGAAGAAAAAPSPPRGASSVGSGARLGAWCRGSRCPLRRRRLRVGPGIRARAVGVKRQKNAAFADLVAELDLEILDFTGRRRWHVHGRLVRFERYQRILRLDR